MDTNSNSHQHVLRTFDDFVIDLGEVGPFESLESKEVVGVVTLKVELGLQHVEVLLDDVITLLREERTGIPSLWVLVVEHLVNDPAPIFSGFFVEVGDGNSCR